MGSRCKWLVLLVPFAYACGAEGEPVPAELPFVSAAPDAGDVGEVGDSGDAGTSSALHRDGSVSGRLDGGSSGWMDDPLTADSACAASTMAAEKVVVTELVDASVTVTSPAPVALYVMLDQSLSMNGAPFGPTPALWPPAVAALKQFVQSPASSGMDMALQFFPTGGASCNGSGYSSPSVAMGRLPANANAIINGIPNSPGGLNTPIEGALRGVTQYCTTFQAAHPSEHCVAVLVTDGNANGCESNSDKLAAIAGDAWTKFQVRTFAVGLQGADFALLDKIAQAGGAADCDTTSARFSCDVSAGASMLEAALTKIRDTVTTVQTHIEYQTTTQTRPLDCEWLMPAPSAGMTVDTDRVNVRLGGGSAAALDLGRVPGADTCKAAAWYFDVPSAPTRILACPQTCSTIKASGYTDVNILLGCETHLLLL